MGRIFHGWAIVAGAFSILFVAYGTQFSFGIFFAALLDEFGWTRGSLSGVFALYTTVYCLFALPAGRWTDRWGPRPVIVLGGLALGSALAGMSQVSQLWQPYVLYGLVAAVGMGTAFVSCSSTVVRWFVRRRGLAVGIASSGASLGTIVLPPLAQVLVTVAGWRTAYVLFGVAILVVLTLAARLMQRDPESMGLRPDGLSPIGTGASLEGEGHSLGQALRTRTFWMLIATFIATWFTIFIPAVHLAPFARDLGFPPLTGASAVSVLGAGALIGRFLMGVTSDSLGRKPVLAVAIALQGLAYLGFSGVSSLPMLMATAFGLGFAYSGNSVLFPAMVGDFFGRQHVGTLVGFIFAITGLFAGLGPLAAGTIHDATGSYRPAFAVAAASNFLAVVILGMARPPCAPHLDKPGGGDVIAPIPTRPAEPAEPVSREAAMAKQSGSNGVDRRVFLKTVGAVTAAAAAGGIPGILEAQKAPSFPKGTKLNILEWVSFVPASDVEFKRLAAEFGKLAGVEVTVDLINMNDLNPRIASAIETKAGPDIIMMISNWPHLYADGLADVDDVAEEIAKRDGAYYEHNKKVSVVGGSWKAVPLCSVPSTWAYREDWFKEAGASKFPDTWDEWRKVGIVLKKKNRPMGQAFGHSLGDPNNWAYSVTWGFGGAEIDQSGKVVINSKETLEAVKFTVAVWKDCLDEGGLAWDDTNNNRAFLAGTISATINGASIYFVAKRQFPDIAKVTGHGHMPKGPGGRFYSIGGQGRAVMKYSKNQQVAKEFLRWFMDRPQYDKWMAANDGYVVGPTPHWEKHALWEKDPKLAPFKESVRYGRWPGYPGQPSRKASEALVKYILVDMYAQAIKGMKAEDAVKWAEGELKKAYA